jgi:hypothetical protein
MAVTITYDKGGETRNLAFDATVSESHTQTAVPTEHAVEKGANIVDHVRPAQPKLSIEAFVTNAPIVTPGSHTRNETGQVEGVPKTNASAFQMSGRIDRVGDLWDEISEMVDTAALVTIQTSLRKYDSMVLTSLTTPRAAATGDAVRFNFEAVKIRLVSSQTVELSAPKLRPKKRGQQSAKEVKKDEPLKSLAATGLDGITSAVGG